MEPQVSIYAILNPKDNEVLYVGASLRPEQRYAIHKYAGEWHPVTRRYKIVKALAKEKILPVMKILEVCDMPLARDRENYWINHYKNLGFKLRQGGSGYDLVRRKTMEEKAKEVRDFRLLMENPVFERHYLNY